MTTNASSLATQSKKNRKSDDMSEIDEMPGEMPPTIKNTQNNENNHIHQSSIDPFTRSIQ